MRAKLINYGGQFKLISLERGTFIRYRLYIAVAP
jgi:hypothetical protein